MYKQQDLCRKAGKNWLFRKKNLASFFMLIAIAATSNIYATKLVTVKVVDKDYIQIVFKDGDVGFVDDGLGETAFANTHRKENAFVTLYGSGLDIENAVKISNWKLKSPDDADFGKKGKAPLQCFRKSKLNGMREVDWVDRDWTYDYTMEHSIYLKLPASLKQGKSYTLEINADTNSDLTSQSFTYDIFSCPTEAIHVNLAGYSTNLAVMAADLYCWMGDGGARDYKEFEDKAVYLYNLDTKEAEEVGKVLFWKASAEEGHRYDFTRSDVWNVDFSGFKTPGNYRLAVEGVGCSEDFIIADQAYHEPFMISTQGFYYMRIGEDRLDMVPVPRRPLYIPGVSPENTSVEITTMQYKHPEWRTFSRGDVWDNPKAWAPYSTGKTNPNAYGGHSDALDWDRHLGHVSIIYDMLLPFILTDGVIANDDLDIGESGNGIPDILDEARNEVDFWLRLRDGKAYSCGLTNPNRETNILYQAGDNAIAAWVNAANSAMLAECFRIAGDTELAEVYKDSAVAAFLYAGSLDDQMLDFKHSDGNGRIRGRDLKMTAAAYLYNLTGDKAYEDIVAAESTVKGPDSDIMNLKESNQVWGCAGYLKTNQAVHYPDLYENMRAAVINEAKKYEAGLIMERPSRRATDDESMYFHTSQCVDRTILAHAFAVNKDDKEFFEKALVLEADWGLGRNPANLIQMTTASTSLESKRSIEACYTSGNDDGTPGQHPGHTPYLNTDNWGGMIMARPAWMTEKSYPASENWPKGEVYFNTRFVWSHGEFTPQQTMRGKMALYGYLYGLELLKQQDQASASRQ